MEPNVGALPIIAEVGIGFVGFSTIVAVLQQSFGRPFTPFQILLVHFYIETGFLNVLLAILPVALFSLFDSEVLVWQVSIFVTLFLTCLYLPIYVRRRRKAHAPNPFISWSVIIGYGFSTILLILTLTEVFWQPSVAVVTTYLLWAFSSSAVIFVYFLSSFLKGEEPT